MFFSFQGDYIWIEPVTRREFDVAIGARVISADGRKIQVHTNVLVSRNHFGTIYNPIFTFLEKISILSILLGC